MKKISYLAFLTAFLLVSKLLTGQINHRDFPFTENFDSVEVPALPEGWTAENTSESGITWVTFDAFANSPPNCAAVFGNGQPKNEWLFTPAIELTAGFHYRISFFYRTSYTPQQVRLRYGPQPTSSQMYYHVYLNNQVNNTQYNEVYFILSAQESEDVFFGWNVFDNGNYGNFYLDDIFIEQLPLIPYITISPSSYNFGTLPAGGTQIINAFISNEGGAPLTLSHPNNVYPFYSTLEPQTILPGSSHTTIIGFNPNEAGFFNEELEFTIIGSFLGSNTINLSGYAYTLDTNFFENFEGYEEIPPDWSSIIQSTSTTAEITLYQADQNENHAHSGEQAVLIANSTVNDLLLFITPFLANLNNGEITFWTKTATWEENLFVGTLETPDNPESFFQIAEITSTPEYAQHTFHFSESPANHSYIAFKHGTSAEDRSILIDDIEWQTSLEELLPPHSLEAQPGNGYVNLSWSPPAGNNNIGYNIYRDDQIISYIMVDTLYTDNDVENGVTYSYYITAIYSWGESDTSNIVTVTPQENEAETYPPINLRAEVFNLNNVFLEWDEPDYGNWISWDNGWNFDGVGTNTPRTFDVAFRFTPEDLEQLEAGGKYLHKISFFPRYGECIYTIKVWAGGGIEGPEELLYSRVVDNIVTHQWNTAGLEYPVFIDGNTDFWFGYEVNTSGGFPAGCDSGPSINGKGNMVYFEGMWSTLLDITPTLDYNWNIQGLVSSYLEITNLETISAVNLLDKPSVHYSFGESLSVSGKNNYTCSFSDFYNRDKPDLLGYNIYRNGVLIGQNEPDSLSYYDYDIADGTHYYYVTAVYEAGESLPGNSVEVFINTKYVLLFEDDFSGYSYFALDFPPWTTFDLDQSPTKPIENVYFPNSGNPMSFIVFTPSQTNPPLDVKPLKGTGTVAAFSAINPPNDDWLITPNILLGQASYFSFWAKSFSNVLEKIQVAVSTSSLHPKNFQIISENPYIEVPQQWTQYSFDLSDYDNSSVYISIKCISEDAHVLFIDNAELWSVKLVENENKTTLLQAKTNLIGNYPNPFNPDTTIKFSLESDDKVIISIYNILGQRVNTLLNQHVKEGIHQIVWDGKDNYGRNQSSGIYFYRLKTSTEVFIKKMLLLK